MKSKSIFKLVLLFAALVSSFYLLLALVDSVAVFALESAGVNASGANSLERTDSDILAAQNKEVLITVNGEGIPRWMFDNAFRDALLQAKKKNSELAEEEKAGIWKSILENLAAMEALEQEAERRGLAVGKEGGKLRVEVVRGGYKHPEKFRQALSEAGMTEEQYVELWRQQASVNQLVEQAVISGIKVKEEELRERYERDKHKYPRKDGKPADLEEIREILSEIVLEEKRRQAFEAFKEALMAKAEITVHDPVLRAVWEQGHER